MAEQAFQELIYRVRACRLCPNVVPASAVLGPNSGRTGATVMFVGEAPGRFGGARTGVPFSGDRSGANFEQFIEAADLHRSELFITNAVLCLPLDAQGRNRPVRASEVRACLPFLSQTLELFAPRIVVPLGARALGALERIEKHGLSLRTGVARAWPWRGCWLFPLYHPSPHVVQTGIRGIEQQILDYRALRAFIGSVDYLISASTGNGLT